MIFNSFVFLSEAYKLAGSRVYFTIFYRLNKKKKYEVGNVYNPPKNDLSPLASLIFTVLLHRYPFLS